MNARNVAVLSALSFASFWMLIAIVGALEPKIVVPLSSNGQQNPTNPIFSYSIPLSAAGWVAVGLVSLQGRLMGGGVRHSRIKSIFASRGFGPDVYDLMVGMRGGGSRLTLLQNMESPRHRLELAELTGIDWKEVDRQLSVLEKYGLVKMYAQSGTVKLYQVTEHGKLLLKLVAELDNKPVNG